MKNEIIDIIKIGGSVITDKSSYKKLHLKNLKNVCKEISKQRNNYIIIHGAGSYGHVVADEFSISSGYTNDSQLNGLIQIREDMTILTQEIVKELILNGIKGIAFQTSALIYVSQREAEIEHFLKPVNKALQLNLTPVLSGDVVFKDKEGFSIFSGDSLIDILVQNFSIRNVYFLSNVDGLFVQDSASQQIQLVENLDAKKLEKLELHDLSEEKTIDVTGLMQGKLDVIKSVSKYVEQIKIVNGFFPERISKVLAGEKTICTTIRGEKST